MTLTDILLIILLTVIGLNIFLLLRKSGVNKEQSGEIKDLERRLTDLMINQMKEIRGNVDGTSKAMYEQIHSFTKEATQIREGLKQMKESMKDISSFQEIFKSPKLRGQWGEASLGHILNQHFPQDLYKLQYLFSSGEQVDAVLLLPNKKILPIDAKFPSENFAKMVESQTEEEKELYQKKFVDDVKFKINDISSKYILPSESTVDFALMYIPAEAVYYEIINNISRKTDIADYAWSKRVILTSPNTIYLTLRTIEHWFKDTQISHKTQDILKRLNRIYLDSKKLSESFRRLGSHLRNSVSAYDNSEKRLSLFSERVEKLTQLKEKKKLK